MLQSDETHELPEASQGYEAIHLCVSVENIV